MLQVDWLNLRWSLFRSQETNKTQFNLSVSSPPLRIKQKKPKKTTLPNLIFSYGLLKISTHLCRFSKQRISGQIGFFSLCLFTHRIKHFAVSACFKLPPEVTSRYYRRREKAWQSVQYLILKGIEDGGNELYDKLKSLHAILTFCHN